MNIPLFDGCDVILYKQWLSEKECQCLIKSCKELQYLGGKTSFGKGQVPRLQKYFNNDGIYFSEVWKQRFPRWEPFVYPEWLFNLQKKVSVKSNNEFNSSLINYYRDGNDTMRPHQDDQPVWGENPTIASLSLGETRKFIFDPVVYDEKNPRSMKTCRNRKTVEIELHSGDFLIMKGKTQQYYKHSVPSSDTKNPRWNITFRKVIR